MSDLNVSVIMRLVNRMRGGSREVRSDLQRIEERTRGVERQTRQTSRAQVAMGQAGRLAMRGVAIGAAAAGVAAGNSVRQAVTFEDRWSDANKTLELTPLALEQLKDQVDEMATRIPVARDGLVDIVAAAGQIGIRGSADILAFTEDAAKMAETFDVSAGAAGGMMSEWRSQMGYTQDEVRLLADKINYLGNTTGASSAKLAQYSSNIVGIADAAGMTEDVTLAFGAAIIASGRAPEVAATGMRGLFRTMTKGIDDMSKAESKVLNRIGLATQWDGIKDQMQTDAAGAIKRVVEAINTLPEADRASATTRLFGEEAHRALGVLLSDADKLQEALERLPGIAQAAGSMEAEYLALSDDVIDNWKRVSNALAARSSKFGASMLAPINNGLKGFLNLLTSLEERATIFDRLGTAWQGFTNGLGGEEMGALKARIDEITTALGNFLFGVEGEDAGEVLAKVFRNAQALGERVGAVRDALVSAVGPIIEHVARLRDAAWQGLGERMSAARDAIAASIGPIADQLVRLRDAAGQLMNGDFDGARALVQDFLSWVTTLRLPRIDFSQMLPDSIANIGVVKGAADVLTGLWDLIAGLSDFVRTTAASFLGGWFEGFSASIEPTVARLSSVYDQIAPILDNFSRIFSSLASAFGGASDSDDIQSWFATFGRVTGQIVGTGIEVLATVLEGIARAIVAVTGAVASALEGDFAGAADSIREFFTWLADLVVPDWLAGFSLDDLLPDFDAGAVVAEIKSWFDFSWADVLPTWDWGAIIPDLPDFGSLFGGAQESIDVRLEAKASTMLGGDWQEGIDLVNRYRDGVIGLGELRAQLDAKASESKRFGLDGFDVNRAQAMLEVLDDVQGKQAELAQAAPTVAEVKADTGDVEVLQAKIKDVLADADAMPAAVQAAVRQAEQAATLDLTAAGLAMMQSLATGIRTGTAEVVAAVRAMADQVRTALPTAPAVRLATASPAAAAVQAAPVVQARAKGGAFNPGWLLTGEEGAELEYRDRGGFVAHHGQLLNMLRTSDTIRRNLGRVGQMGASGRPMRALSQLAGVAGSGGGLQSMIASLGGGSGPQAQLQGMMRGADTIRRGVARSRPAGEVARQVPAQAASSMSVGDIHIHAAPGMDPAAIAREVRRELGRIQGARRGDLHDGVDH